MEKCQPDDPRRCKGTSSVGQCPYFSLDGEQFCEKHMSPRGALRHRREKVERYLIDQQELRMSYMRQQDDKEYLNMKDEILLIQALLEQKINSITNKTELLTAIPGINALVQRLESMKSTLLKMQRELGLVLGKDRLRSLAEEIATILDEELTGVPNKVELLEQIGLRIVDAIEVAGKENLVED